MTDNLTLSTKKVRWACRRGMLELDLLLLPFFEVQYPNLLPQQQADFVRLLEYPDPEIYAWLMGHEVPTEPHLQALVQFIKQHAVSKI